jgi:hypothetical protein
VVDDKIEIDVSGSDVPHRHLPVVGRRRPARQHNRLGGAHHAYSHRHCRGLPDASRSQHKNRATAWNMLRARLYEQELEKREAAANATGASKTDIGWGHQIRSYVLQPYQLVKDLRTGVTNPPAPTTCWTAISTSSWRPRSPTASKAAQFARRGRRWFVSGLAWLDGALPFHFRHSGAAGAEPGIQRWQATIGH